jgi:hypothetical protein
VLKRRWAGTASGWRLGRVLKIIKIFTESDLLFHICGIVGKLAGAGLEKKTRKVTGIRVNYGLERTMFLLD